MIVVATFVNLENRTVPLTYEEVDAVLTAQLLGYNPIELKLKGYGGFKKVFQGLQEFPDTFVATYENYVSGGGNIPAIMDYRIMLLAKIVGHTLKTVCTYFLLI